MLTINNLMKPQLIMGKCYFTDNLGEVLYDNTTVSYEKRKEFLRNYGKCRVVGIDTTHQGFIQIMFNLPHCPICDVDCPYFYVEGMAQYCTCTNPVDECTDYAMRL